MVVPSQDVRDPHQMIIDDHRKIVCRDTILFDDDKITEIIGLERDLAFHHIIKRIHASGRHFEAYARLATFRS